jgi:type I restriction enzyme R subunit
VGIKDRADRILQDLENRATTGLAALEMLATLIREKESALSAAKESGLSPRAFAVEWRLKDDESLKGAGIQPRALAREADTQVGRFPNARQNPDEHRKLRAALYRPLLAVSKAERGRIVDLIITILLDGRADGEA